MFFSIVTTIIVVVSCRYKPLEYDFDHTGLCSLTFDWQGNISCMTSFMSISMHEDAVTEPRRFDLPGMDGGSFRVHPGRWTPVAWNGDVPAILFKKTLNPDTYVAYTSTTSVKVASKMKLEGDVPQVKSESERVINEPDPLWFASGKEMEIKPNELAPTQVLYMEPRTITLNIVITDIANLGSASQFAGSLSGLADGVNCASGIPTLEPATEAFYLYRPEDSTLATSFEVFGLCPEVDEKYPENWLTIYFILGDGTRFYCTINVTETLRNIPLDNSTRTLELAINGSEAVSVPAPIEGSSGFEPSIDDWYGVEISLGMNPNP